MTAHAVSQYEIERNKPIPNLVHGLIQSNLNLAFRLKYRDQYMFPNELSLATIPGSTPDICIYPKRIVSSRNVSAKESETPITTIEIQSPSQSIDELISKAWNLYFPMGVKSAWIVIPALKAVQILLPDEQKILFTTGIVEDPATNIEIELNMIFEGII
ncbi:MAG: Uma2 family endonuclease [Bacteroidota bacterium]